MNLTNDEEFGEKLKREIEKQNREVLNSLVLTILGAHLQKKKVLKSQKIR